MKRHSFRLAAAALGLLLVLPTGLPASAASSFDAGYYATHYPDVAAACGTASAMKDGTDVADKASAAALLPQIQAEVMA